MKAAYVKAPFQFEIRDVGLRGLTETEILVDVKCCGVCGHDLILARYGAAELQQFGHEVSGVVEAVGGMVGNVKPGDKVVLESGTFDRFSDSARNGRVDLNNRGPNFWIKGDDNMGFAEKLIAPCECAVRFDGLDFDEVCLAEPLGVALDLFKTADVKIMNDVLVLGLGPIGLMAAKIAKASGARKVYAAELSPYKARIELAKKWGVDEVIFTDEQRLEDYPFEKGGVDRALVTAPPKVIPSAMSVCNVGAHVSFLGIDYTEEGFVSIDSTLMHSNKLQLRASNASPALYFPDCIDIIKSGMVPAGDLITHRFALDDIAAAIPAFEQDRGNAIKAVMVNER
jgi:threonine dehydrogenase-like Zn-dependent dehydrogenase